MVITPEQERVRTLIADTVSLLCKNGLHYTKEFSIEGLLGITLDRDQVFLVNINEIVKSDGYKSDSDSGGSDGSDGGTQTDSKSKKRKKKKRRKSKEKTDASDDQGDDNTNDTTGSFAQPSSVDTNEPPAKKMNIKEENTDSEEDLVFIKDEPGSISGSQDYSNASFSNYPGAQNNILGDMSQQGQLYATPQGGDPNTSSWDPSAFNQSLNQSLPSQQQPSTSGSQPQPSPGGQQPTDDTSLKCAQCGRNFVNDYTLRRHMRMHKGVFDYYCKFCNKPFSNSTNLKEHLPVHTNVNYFKCDICNLDFRYYVKMRNHKNIVHGEKGESMNFGPMPPQQPL